MNDESNFPKSIGMQRLIDVVGRLRGEDGCPWDRKQTLDSLKPHLIEECYELIDAIESGDVEHHREELGDVLLHIALQSQIRSEQGEFAFDDVAEAICEKLIRRHPHVFDGLAVSGTDEVLKNWEAIKASEKGDEKRSLLEGLPKHLPALQKAQRVQTRAQRVGFDWTDVSGVVAKIEEELSETKQALDSGDIDRVEDELGDLLFTVVNLCRFKEIDAEAALRKTVARFVDRFKEMESTARAECRELKDCTEEELDVLWEAAKEREQKG
jgi:tetrapyrrole methylase family protein/MazG family protein